VRRALVLVAAVAALASACSGGSGAGESVSGASTATAATGATGPEAQRPREALVTVVDGDLGTRVEGAEVRVGRETGASGPRGLARVPLRRKAPLPVEIAAPGYVTKRIRLDFSERRRYTIRIYQERLQWPIYGATPERTQAQLDIELRPPFRTVWSRGVRSLIEFPAVVWEGVAYVNTLRGVLSAIAMRDGRVLWQQQIGTKNASSPAIVPERREVLVTTMEPGDFQVRDLRTGELEWSYPTGLTEPSPVVRDGVAYFAATNGNVYAIDLERREPRWIYSAGAKITSSPALAGDRLYVGDYAGRVLCLDAATGDLIWSATVGSRVYGTVAVADGRVFAPDVGSGFTALSAQTGEVLWRVGTGTYTYASPAVFRDRVFFADYSGTVYAADTATGSIAWSASAGGAVSGALVVVDGVVYAGSFGDRITGWSWKTGREVISFPHGQYVPLSGNGGHLLLHGFSRIYAVEPVRKAS
jgi:outer membrane protein assembly factor BamB